MMSVLAITLGVAIVGALGLIVWLVHGRIADVRGIADDRVKHTATNGRLERRDFEFMTLTKQLQFETRRADVFEEALANAENPNGDLGPRDVHARVVRAAAKARAAQAARGGAVPSVPVEPVRPTPAPERAATAEVHGPLDPNERLL